MSTTRNMIGKAVPAERIDRAVIGNSLRFEHPAAITLRFGEGVHFGIASTGTMEVARLPHEQTVLGHSASPVTTPANADHCPAAKEFILPLACSSARTRLIYEPRATVFTGRHVKMRV